ncbi:aspartyl-phosphate phosphatase Spo0E family protein [Paenibacillus dendritiformis]|uniref:aspartyl-phosphate phosphatase Spo0E family protein n=1 Tax=Paenibacillus dendritiformis TaxID=130049 RepID=UPI00248BD92F|nr:aspartyl-phosphate phosphatase Spo0E family protein [Paenibacillus dendritiformis]WGU97181.1 aspartyl-phosphate phosphatase Spo0E family protein [Paenibacillus dendritiformis]
MKFSLHSDSPHSVVIVIALMLRTDYLGMTSVNGDLSLYSRCYESLIHFFPSSLVVAGIAWVDMDLDRETNGSSFLCQRHRRVDRRCDEAAEGSSPDASRQETPSGSESSSKVVYISGYLFGAIDILIRNNAEVVLSPLVHELARWGETIFGWSGSFDRNSYRKIYFTDDEVVSVSQELDYYLVEFQRKMLHEQADR